jgi:hypothetical protein
MADDLPPGVHFNADGRVATVVYEGVGPDPGVMTALQARVVPTGLVITTDPTPENTSPPNDRTIWS